MTARPVLPVSVAVTASPPPVDVLRRIHADLRRASPQPDFDGLYVSGEDLRRDPAAVPLAALAALALGLRAFARHRWRGGAHDHSHKKA